MTFEYYDKIRPDIIKKAEHMYAKYVNVHDELFAERQRRTARVEYSRDKSHGLRLSYYCPNPIKELVIGNVKRGRILKRKSYFASADIIFFFDGNDELIGAEEKFNVTDEEYYLRQHYIINEYGYNWILSFDSDMRKIEYITLWCKEDGKISLYIELTTSNYLDDSCFGRLANLDVWLFSYCQNIPVSLSGFANIFIPRSIWPY